MSHEGTPPPRSPRASYTEMTELVLPQHSNAIGTAFGGTVLAWMDICAAIAAQRHCGRTAVTAAIDNVKFLAPMRVGDVVVLAARVNAAFSSSVEVEIEVQVEDRATMHRRLCVDAFMTFVCVDEKGKAVKVPPLLCETADDERRAKDAEARRARRLAER
ncbi:acyl-CoA thioesterase [Sandaracinus amylolyticus]|uniref:acyl-CoA thioesterase n=1 Tax=Sandaracinus amylolyticus TaxID=927083 RepID=UPI001F2B8FFA|nr:acyl-CoA thioesterase [Sandaracinus amylolyticus]